MMMKRPALPLMACMLAACALAEPQLDRGDLHFDYPPSDPVMTVQCRPMQWLDGRFYLSQGDPSMFVFAFGNPSGKDPEDPHLMVALPKEVKIAALHVNLELLSSEPWEAGRVLHDFKLARQASIYASEKGAAASRGLSLLVTTEAEAGAKLPDLVFWYRDGERESLRSVLKLKVLPPIRARMPQHFKAGVMLRKPTFYLRGDGLEGLYGQFVKRCGIGWVIGGRNAPTTLSCLKADLDVATESGLANGYMLGWGMHPKDVAFYRTEGIRFKRALCPTAIYTNHPYVEKHLYQEAIHKLIAKDRTCNHISTNWEPYMFIGKGCFCERCREEFIRWSKLPAEEVRKAWPLGVVKRHRTVWEKFFAWQHGRVVITLEKMCQKAGKEVGIDSHFFPQIACTLVNPERSGGSYFRLTDIEQYIDEVRWIQIWGGYMTWDITAPRRRGIGARLGLHQYAGMARAWAQKHLRDGKPPTISWGHGTYLGTTLCTFPEGITFDILCCFLNGIDRTAGYVFPMGYDNRYWAAVAKAADIAAGFEEYVRNGKQVEQHSLEPVTPVPKVEAGPILRSLEFERDGHRLVAVGNFWREGEAFFRLKVTGFEAQDRLSLSEPWEGRRLTSPSGKPYWTGEELEKGALLHVGRLRWAFFIIDPGSARADEFVVQPRPASAREWVTVSQEDITSVMEERLPTIKLDHQASLALIAEMVKAKSGEPGDYSRLRPLKLGGLTSTIKDVNDDQKPEIIYAREGEELVIEPAKGARALSWKLDGFEVAHQLGEHSLANDATWAPAHFVSGEVKVIRHEVVEDGMVLGTERLIPAAARECLPGIKVTRTLFVPRAPGSFRVTTQLTNTGKQIKEFAYRHTASPSFLTRTTEDEGWVCLWGKEGPIEFKRNFQKNAYHLAGKPRTPRLDTYAMDISREVTEPRVRFGCGWSPVEVEALIDKDKLYKFVFWDSIGTSGSSAEFVCHNLKLKPGESWDVTVEWKRVK